MIVQLDTLTWRFVHNIYHSRYSLRGPVNLMKGEGGREGREGGEGRKKETEVGEREG